MCRDIASNLHDQIRSSAFISSSLIFIRELPIESFDSEKESRRFLIAAIIDLMMYLSFLSITLLFFLLLHFFPFKKKPQKTQKNQT